MLQGLPGNARQYRGEQNARADLRMVRERISPESGGNAKQQKQEILLLQGMRKMCKGREQSREEGNCQVQILRPIIEPASLRDNPEHDRGISLRGEMLRRRDGENDMITDNDVMEGLLDWCERCADYGHACRGANHPAFCPLLTCELDIEWSYV